MPRRKVGSRERPKTDGRFEEALGCRGELLWPGKQATLTKMALLGDRQSLNALWALLLAKSSGHRQKTPRASVLKNPEAAEGGQKRNAP